MKTEGSVTYDARTHKFEVQCTPDVTIRIKRLFTGAEQGLKNRIRISANPNSCKDLCWFLDRYPMDVACPDILFAGRDAFDSNQTVALEIVSGKFTGNFTEMLLQPREYQKIAAALAIQVGGLLLADDLGLGKTISAIATIFQVNTPLTVVVCQPHLQQQWERELRRCLPNVRTHIAKKGQPYNTDGPDGISPDVLIVPYSKMSGWAGHLLGKVHTVVFDECQDLRRSGSDRYTACKSLATSAKVRLGLSATPIFNYGEEFFNVLDVLRPDGLGTRTEFIREWCTSSYATKQARLTDPAAFGAFLRSNNFMLRRTRADVGQELPALNRIQHTVSSDISVLKEVESGATELARVILDQSGCSSGLDKMMSASELSNVLRQATGIAKAVYVAEFVKMLLETGEKVVLFGWHRAVYAIWEEKLAEYKPAWYTGHESSAAKDRAFQSFVAGETNLLVVSLRSGAGLDGLQTVCSTVVIGELDWSPKAMEQCIGRVFRPGQEKSVFAYYLVADSGADPIMAEVLGAKNGQINPVVDPSDELFEESPVDPGHIRRLAESYLNRDSFPKGTVDTPT